MSRANEPAYPWECAPGLQGLTIREHFAAMAMQGLLARGFQSETENMITERGELLSKITRNLRQQAVHEADALLAELAKVKP